MNPQLEDALLFFSLSPDFAKEDLKKKYRELALKYHPDRGEYTSDVLFVQLLQYYSFLESYLDHREGFSHPPDPPTVPKSTQDGYPVYKELKTRENEAILHYFQSRKNLKAVELDPSKNKELIELKTKLEKLKQEYEHFLKHHPASIWNQDVLDSLETMKVWFK